MENFTAPALWSPGLLPLAQAAAQTVKIARYGAAGYITAPTDDPPNTLYAARLLGDVDIRQSGVDAFGVGGRVAITAGLADLDNTDHALDGAVRYGLADGRRITVRALPAPSPQASNVGTALLGGTVMFRGVVRAIQHAPRDTARVIVGDIAQRLETPLQTTLFAGTGGMEGPAELAGRPKPVALGSCFNVAPVHLGNIDLGDGSLPTYAVSWRSVQDITAVRMRGVAQALVGTAPTVGEARVWANSGVFQLGASADGLVTADVEGDKTPTYVSTTAGIVRRLVQALGPGFSDAEIQAEAFSLHDTAVPGAVGWWRGPEETTAAAAVDEILAGSGSLLAGGRDGTVRMADPLAAGSAQFAIPPGWVVSLAPVDPPAALRPFPASVAVEWGRNWAPGTDFAGSVSAADQARLAGRVSGPARAASATIAARVASTRDLRLPGLYAAESDALARAQRWRDLFEAGPRFFDVAIDRYRGQIEIGDRGVLAWPRYNLDAGVGVVVLAWRELPAAARLVLTVMTVPWITVPPGGALPGFFVLDSDILL